MVGLARPAFRGSVLQLRYAKEVSDADLVGPIGRGDAARR